MTVTGVDQGGRLRRPAGIRTLQLGEMKVSYVPDGAVQLPPRGWLPATTEEDWATRSDYLDATGHLVASIGALLVERGDRALLIDAGFGPQSQPPAADVPAGAIHGGGLLVSLAALGRRPEEIEAIAFTHLHPDHVGWAWHPLPGSDRTAFPHAEYLVTGEEWAQREALAARGLSEVVTAMAPQVRTVSDGQEIFPGVHVRTAGGHTPGHAEYVLSSGGQRLIAFGDALHTPVQVDHPEWSAAVDHDPDRAAEQRRRLLAELAEPDTVGFGVHFADVVFGRVRQDGDGPAWRPLED
ncbi:MBL fold metallo-hydrolase [Streptomyces sp. NPDC059740]|uniref:MBL fold metallo-hydrolase n=1 Tax=Streptomyces sp. NPDC059740 TaxID=3346926 RepID=UPI00365AD750